MVGVNVRIWVNMSMNNLNKKISVIVPVYNTENYVERCIRSILAQTYENLEIICVDDGSTDKSGTILDGISKEDNRLRVIHNGRSGVGISRNIAMQEATGDYYGFVDSDDYIASDMYLRLLSAIEENNVDIVTCSYYLDYDGKIEITKNRREVSAFPMKMDKFLQYVWERDIYKGVANYLWTKLYRKNLIKDEKGELINRFESGFSGTDIVFNARVCICAKSILYVDMPLYYYTQRKDSIVHNSLTQLNTLSWVKAYEQILDIYYEQGVQKNIIEMVQRMYVYRCGRVLEEAIKQNDKDKIITLRNKIKEYFPVYVKTNLPHIDRIKWMLELL